MSIKDEDRIKGDILQTLRNNTKGMTVTEISRHIGLNRNSTAKYLDILKMNGQIDLRPMGRAKLYYISQRVPIHALLDFSTDYILVIDSRMSIVEVNDNFQRFFNIKKDMLLDVDIRSSNLPIFTTRESQAKIKHALKGKDSTFEAGIVMERKTRFLKGKLIPSTLGDGTNGVTVIMENVTEQKEAEKMLKESEMRYRELIENQGEGLGVTDTDDIFKFANPAAERIMGVGPGQLNGRSIKDFLSRDERRKVDLHNERRRRGKKDTYQLEINAADGKKKIILLTATPRYDSEGTYKGSFGVFRDITLMKENEKRTEASEERYRSLFEASSDAIIILKNRSIVQCNLSTIRMFGYDSKDEMIGLDPSALSPQYQDNGRTSESEVMRRLNEASVKGFVNMKWNHMRKDGTPFLADVRINKINIAGDVLFQAVVRDITELEDAKNDLERNESKLRNILSSLHGSFIGLINRDLIYEEFWGTEELNAKYGIDFRDLVGMSITDFIDPVEKVNLIGKLDLTFNEGIPFRIEHKAPLPNGRFFQEWSFSPFKNDKGEIEYIVQFGRDTHDKNLMLEELMKVEERYNLLDKNVNDVIWMTDLDLNYTYVSSSVKNLLGYPVEEILSMKVMNTLTETSREIATKELASSMRDFRNNKLECPAPVTLELMQKDRSGKEKWTEVSISFLTGSEGEPKGLMGVTRYIGRRKEAQLESSRNQRKLKNILSSLYYSFIGLINKDYVYEEFWGSKELDGMFGIDAGNIKGLPIFDFAPEENKEELRVLLDRVFSTGIPIQIEVPGHTPKGTFWEVLSFTPFYDNEGNIEYVVQFGTDTTEKRKALMALKEVERKYRLLDDNASDLIWITGEDLNYTYISSPIKKLTGFEPGELIGTDLLERIYPLDKEKFLEEWEGLISAFLNKERIDQDSIKLELDLRKKNGEPVSTEINITIIKDDQGLPKGLIGVTRDISDRKRIERKLLRKDSILESIYKMGSRKLEPSSWRETISGSLGDLGRATDVSRVYVFKNDHRPDGNVFTTQIMEWTADDIDSQFGNPDLEEFCMNDGFRRWIDLMSDGRSIQGDIKDFPDIERSVLEMQSIMSIVSVPIMVKDIWWGFIGFDECKKPRVWSREEIRALEMAGIMLGSLISVYGVN